MTVWVPTYQTMQYHNPEDHNTNLHWHEKIVSYKYKHDYVLCTPHKLCLTISGSYAQNKQLHFLLIYLSYYLPNRDGSI